VAQEKWRRPDVELLMVTPKMSSLAKRVLGEYRRRLLEDSFVLATRGTSPSAGFITTYLLMLVCRYRSRCLMWSPEGARRASPRADDFLDLYISPLLTTRRALSQICDGVRFRADRRDWKTCGALSVL